MEYTLILEQSRKFKFFVLGIIFIILMMFMSVKLLGLYGYASILGLLFFTVLTPLFYGRYKLFLFLWLFLIPVLSVQKTLMIGGTNLSSFFMLGLSFPFAFFLFYKHMNEVFKKLPYVIPLFVFLVTLFLNIFRLNAGFSVASQPFKVIFTVLFIIFITYFFTKNDDEKVEKFLDGIIIFSVINAFFAVIQKATGFQVLIIEGVQRVGGFLGHPNSCGFFINICVALIIYKLMSPEGVKKRKFYVAALLLNIFAMGLTLSKTSILILAMIIMILILNLPLNTKIKAVSAAFAGFLILIAADLALKLGISENIISRFSDDNSLEWRFNVWRILLSNMDFFSYLFGHGSESSVHYLLQANPGQYPKAHNGYILILYEYGIIGFTYFAGLMYILVNAIKRYRKESGEYRKIALTILLIIAIVLVECLSENVVFFKTPMNYAWVLLTIFYIKLNNSI